MSKEHQNWSAADVARLGELVLTHGNAWHRIGPLLGRGPDACKQKYNEELRRTRKLAQKAAGAKSHKTREENKALMRAAAAAASARLPLPPRSLTAELFGDPLPGRSALDQRRERPDVRSISLAGAVR